MSPDCSISSRSCTLSILDDSERTSCCPRICSIRILQHSHSHLRLCIVVFSTAKANLLVPGRADSQRLHAPRTSSRSPFPSPSPSTKYTAMNLGQHKRRESSIHFRRGVYHPLNARVLLHLHHSIVLNHTFSSHQIREYSPSRGPYDPPCGCTSSTSMVPQPSQS